MRVGFGFDSHPFVTGKPLVIGGVKIPYEKGLSGHSDADVLLHAVADALLGAAGLSSIGELFPDTDPAYKDADSSELLKQVAEIVHDRGYGIVNLDCTVLAEEPKLVPYRDRMREHLSGILGIPEDNIAIKPKRGEGMGFVGRKEGIAAMAVVLLDEL
jgi:2-C-methyl-D-erythritol 2,4-cyclodiphosphate synthase